MQVKELGEFVSRADLASSVEEYFDLLESGMAPLKVLETKGYVSPNVAKILKMRGYPMTLEGMNKMIEDDIAARAA